MPGSTWYSPFVINVLVLVVQRDFKVLRDFHPFGLCALPILLECAFAMRAIGGMIAALTIVQGRRRIGAVGQTLCDGVGHELTRLGRGQGGSFFCA